MTILIFAACAITGWWIGDKLIRALRVVFPHR
jgi:hypothetical protein